MQSLFAMQSFTLANLHFSPLNANVCMFCFQFFFSIFINVCALPSIRTLSNRFSICFDLPAICLLHFFGRKHSFWYCKRCNQPQSMRCNAIFRWFYLIFTVIVPLINCLMPFIFFFHSIEYLKCLAFGVIYPVRCLYILCAFKRAPYFRFGNRFCFCILPYCSH